MKSKFLIFFVIGNLYSFSKIFCQKNSKYTINEKQISEINLLIEKLSNEDKFSGTVLIAKGNKILYEKATGMANKELSIKNNINTKFNLASMNKMFTSIAISQLVEKKYLSFQDKIINHLPELPEKIFGNITIEQLLTHTAGTCDFFRIPQFMDIKDTAKTIKSYLLLGINEPLLFEPGTKFQYSNYGYILLGSVIEKITKMSYYDYVKKNIFQKAGMKNTDNYESDKINSNLAIGYAMPPPVPGERPTIQSSKLLRESNTKIIEVKGTSAGGGYSTAIDLHKFSKALLSGKLVSHSTLASITKGKVNMPIPGQPQSNHSGAIKYGYGFGEVFKNEIRIIGHNGGAPGAEAQLDIYPDLGYTVVVLSNYDRVVMPLMNQIEEIIISKYKN